MFVGCISNHRTIYSCFFPCIFLSKSFNCSFPSDYFSFSNLQHALWITVYLLSETQLFSLKNIGIFFSLHVLFAPISLIFFVVDFFFRDFSFVPIQVYTYSIKSSDKFLWRIAAVKLIKGFFSIYFWLLSIVFVKKFENNATVSNVQRMEVLDEG